MGREVRRVPADWQHPKETGRNWRGELVEQYKPLFPGDKYARRAAEFMAVANSLGLQAAVEEHDQTPDQRDYMPDWPAEQRTHLMMYEDTSEGTPISPAFPTPEELARWLADNNASACGREGASYEAWLAVCRDGWVPSMVITAGKVMSGVEAASK